MVQIDISLRRRLNLFPPLELKKPIINRQSSRILKNVHMVLPLKFPVLYFNQSVGMRRGGLEMGTIPGN